jgi:hypothetical protein
MHRWAHNTVFEPLFKFADFDCAPRDICELLSADASFVDGERP